jgi:hypothetical protein
MILVIRDQKAFNKSRAKKQQALEDRVTIAVKHLPRIIQTKHKGTLRAASRDILRDWLIRDGVLGARRNAKHIAHAKKYDLPLDQWQQRTAETIVDNALAIAEANGMIELVSDKEGRQFEVRLLASPDEKAIPADKAVESDQHDPDEMYPLSVNLSRRHATNWGLQFAHE